MVVSWPARIKDKGGLREQFLHVIDVVPTLYRAPKIVHLSIDSDEHLVQVPAPL